MEYSAFPLELKSLSDAGQIEGLAAGYGNLDLDGDIIAPGAFSGSIAEHKSSSSIAMLLHHDLHRPVGRWESFAETPNGLLAKGRLTLDARDGQEAYALLRDRALTGLSVGFTGAKATRGDRGARIITEGKLVEVSLVSVPANPKARVSSVKAVSSIRDLEDLLHEAGFSGRKAKAAASAAWRAINDTSEHDAAAETIAAILKASSRRLAAL